MYEEKPVRDIVAEQFKVTVEDKVAEMAKQVRAVKRTARQLAKERKLLIILKET